MSLGNAQFDSLHADLFDQFADACTVQRGSDTPVSGRCIVDDGVARIGHYGNVIGRVSKVSFLRSEWQPQRGDVVILGALARKVEAIESDDGFVVEAVLHG